MTGSASSAAMMIARLRPIVSDNAPKNIPPHDRADVSTIAIKRHRVRLELVLHARKVGYRSCVPWEKKLNAVISTIA